MKRTIIAVLLLFAVGLSTGCNKSKDWVSPDGSRQPDNAPTAQQAPVAVRAASVPEPQPITVTVEKTYYKSDVAWVHSHLISEVRISAEDAKSLRDPAGTPKKRAWHLVPEKADGRLRFAVFCIPNRKDCFPLAPGKTYAVELMRQDDPKGAGGSWDLRCVRVNGVGVYEVMDFSGYAD